MRDKLDPSLRLGRVRHPMIPAGDDHNGAFVIRGPAQRKLLLIVSNELGWDHVSVSVYQIDTETPTWEEMCHIKDLVFEPEECVVQYHPPHSRYVNIHPGCLHLWRCQDRAVPMPPLYLV